MVVISSYLPEIMNLSDRILVCRQGRIVEEISPLDATEETIMYAAVHRRHEFGTMINTRAIWTYYKGDWHEGDVRILGAASHATWLGSLVFDGARHSRA